MARTTWPAGFYPLIPPVSYSAPRSRLLMGEATHWRFCMSMNDSIFGGFWRSSRRCCDVEASGLRDAAPSRDILAWVPLNGQRPLSLAEAEAALGGRGEYVDRTSLPECVDYRPTLRCTGHTRIMGLLMSFLRFCYIVPCCHWLSRNVCIYLCLALQQGSIWHMQ